MTAAVAAASSLTAAACIDVAGSPCALTQSDYHTLTFGVAASDSLSSTTCIAFYKIEVGAGNQPTDWTQVALSHVPVVNGLLASWDTRALANGTYTLRLTTVDASGNYGPWDELTVQVQN